MICVFAFAWPAGLVSFLITLGAKANSPWTYTFNFVIEDGRWYYRFLEGIFLRLDGVTSFPAEASGFPDRPEEGKHWMRQETYWSEQVRLFNFLTHEKGKDFAFRWVREGLANGAGSFCVSVEKPRFEGPRSFRFSLIKQKSYARLGACSLNLAIDLPARPTRGALYPSVI